MIHLPKTVLIVTLFLSQLVPVENYAQLAGDPLPPGYYIVVAAYRPGQDSYAKNYIGQINKDGIDAKYGADLGRKYLYVYLDYYTDFDVSIKEMLGARKKEGFEKAWVRIMKDPLAEKLILLTEQIEEHQNETDAVASSPTSVSDEVIEAPVEIEKAETEVNEKIPEAEEEEVVETVDEENPITDTVEPAEPPVFLNLYYSTNSSQVDGEVEIIDAERARVISIVKGNEDIKLPDPESESGKLTLLANVFGYRPLQHDISYAHLASDTLQSFVEWDGSHYLINFNLVKYRKGDINTLINVYFFNDAAIMLPESKHQLNSLLMMMKENMNYRIKLHGHTNGNARGEILTKGSSQSFFALTDDIKKDFGSAKELSNQRALIIKEWLVSEGIDESRIEVKSWGGGRMLHDKHSESAMRNARVDVEILAE